MEGNDFIFGLRLGKVEYVNNFYISHGFMVTYYNERKKHVEFLVNVSEVKVKVPKKRFTLLEKKGFRMLNSILYWIAALLGY